MFLIAPPTANTVAKIANGIADNPADQFGSSTIMPHGSRSGDECGDVEQSCQSKEEYPTTDFRRHHGFSAISWRTGLR